MRVFAISLVLAGLAGLGPNAAEAAVLDFDAATTGSYFGTLNEDGFEVTLAGGHPSSGHVAPATGYCGPPCPEYGSQFLLATGSGVIFAVAASDGSAFDFTGFDGAEAHADRATLWAQDIRVTGTRADASVISQDFTLDWVQDGPGGVQDFQSFSANFTNIVSLTFQGVNGATSNNWFTLDNISVGPATVASVPLPAGALGFATALGALCALRRRQP